jgi:hypothetical protein
MKRLDVTSASTVALTVLTSFFAAGCGSTIKDAKQRFEEPLLMNTWEGKCAKSDLLDLSEKPYFKFSGNFYQEVHTFYSDADCVSPAVDITYKGELMLHEANPEKIRKVDFRFDHVEVAALNPAGKDVLESVGFCGVDTWEVNKAVNLEGKTGTLTCPLRTVPTGEFNLFKLDSEVLYLGKSGLRGGTTTEGSRPTAIETDRPYTKSTRKL